MATEMNIETVRAQLHDLAVRTESSCEVTFLVDESGQRLAALVHYEVGETFVRQDEAEDKLWAAYAEKMVEALDRGELEMIPLEEALRDIDRDEEQSE